MERHYSGLSVALAGPIPQYDKLVASQDRISSNTKRTLLENAVHPFPPLRQVKTDSAQHVARTGNALTYDQYFSLLLSAANNHDAIYAQKRSVTSKRRTVYAHDVSLDTYDAADFADAFDDTPGFDIDSDLSDIQVFAAQRRFGPPRPPCAP